MAAKQAVVDFFDAAEKEDYDTMKTYCTKDFQKYFGKDGETEHWFGFKNAKLRTISLLADDDGAYMRSWFPEEKSGYLFNIEIKGKLCRARPVVRGETHSGRAVYASSTTGGRRLETCRCYNRISWDRRAEQKTLPAIPLEEGTRRRETIGTGCSVAFRRQMAYNLGHTEG